ncbi:DNA-formamidopyrimidine glycosylase family protein [Streptomyces sp. G35A]
MPELPEAEALKDFPSEHLAGHGTVRALPVAISVLRTYGPPPAAVGGHEVTAVRRCGKFLDLETDGGPHLVVQPARAGRLHRKDRLPTVPPRPGTGPLALRTTLVDAVERSRGVAARRLKAEKRSGPRVHGRTGEACPVCGDTVREVAFGDSSPQYRPTCRTGGKPLADRGLPRLLK